jgi:hypothetical protein
VFVTPEELYAPMAVEPAADAGIAPEEAAATYA